MTYNWGSSSGVATMFFWQLSIILDCVFNLSFGKMPDFFLGGFKVGKGGLSPRFARGLLAGRDRK